VLWGIFGAKREEVIGSWNKLLDKPLSFYSMPNIIRMIISRRMRWAGHRVHMEKIMNVYTILFGKPEWKRPFGKPRHRWEENIKIDLLEIWFAAVDQTYMARDTGLWWTLLNMIINPFIP
jgi:hypothetical protein